MGVYRDQQRQINISEGKNHDLWDYILDLHIANPTESKRWLAEQAKIRQGALSRIIKSPSYMEAYKKRRSEITKRLADRMANDLYKIHHRACMLIWKKLNEEDPDTSLIIEAAKLSGNQIRARFKDPDENEGVSEKDVGVSREDLERAREMMRRVKEVQIEGQVIEIKRA